MRTFWIDAHSLQERDHIVDGERLARDTQRLLDGLTRDGYEMVSVTPIQSGRWAIQPFDSRITKGEFPSPTVSPDTCASYGYSMTDGLMVVARKK
jgi:hypothetical protein